MTYTGDPFMGQTNPLPASRPVPGYTPLPPRRRVYIATALENGEELHRLHDALPLGVGLSFDWTAIPGWPPGSAAGNHEVMGKIAAQEIQGVADADLLIALLVEGAKQRGTHAEIGAALALRIPVIVVGTQKAFDECAFYHHPGVMGRIYRDNDVAWMFGVYTLVSTWYRLNA